jgi:hypothetical protein
VSTDDNRIGSVFTRCQEDCVLRFQHERSLPLRPRP